MITQDQRDIAHRYACGESVNDLSYQKDLHPTALYRIIAEVGKDEGVDLKAQHRAHLQQAKIQRAQWLREQMLAGVSAPSLAQQTGMSTAAIYNTMAQSAPRPEKKFQEQHEAARVQELRASAQDLLSEQPEAGLEQLIELVRHTSERAIVEQVWKEHQPLRQRRRAEQFVHLYLTGKTLVEVGAAYGISRERVRQVIESYYPGGFDLAMHSRQARTTAAVIDRRRELLDRARQWLQQRTAVSARDLDMAMNPHREDLSWLHAQVSDRLVRGTSVGLSFSDEQLVVALAQVAARTDEPLTVKRYDAIRSPGSPSAALIVHRLGWNAALRRAGLQAFEPRRHYERRWDQDTIAQWVREFREDVPGGTSMAYDLWQQQRPAAPSLSTVSVVLGGWRQAVEEALR